MSVIAHHAPDELLMAYASGALPYEFALVVATHVSLCDESRARLSAHQAAGGAVLETHAGQSISGDLKARVMASIEDAPIMREEPAASGIFPAPLMDALGGMPPKWRALGGGNRQSILSHSDQGSVRLLYIPGGQAMPDHGHNGLELTLVLQGAFSDASGRFGVGDLEVADDDIEHTPVAEPGQACICLAATDAALRFKSFVPRMLQPFFRI